MKVTVYDIVWAVVSMVIVGVSFRQGRLMAGLVLVYVLMAVLFAIHIIRIKRKIKDSTAVYGEIAGYKSEKSGGLPFLPERYYPIVRYETEDGVSVEAVYRKACRKKELREGDSLIICYSEKEYEFFCFQGRESELTDIYYRMITFGGMIAVLLLVFLIF